MEADDFPFAGWLRWCVLSAVCAFMLLNALDPRRAPDQGPAPVAAPTIKRNPPPARTTLMVPVEGISVADLARQFTEPRSGGREHHAIDIPAPRNTPVLAASDGRIERLMTNTLGGLTIYQRDESGRYVYYYAHLEAYERGISEGDRVCKGEVIAFVGTSGNAAENTPHLHFAVLRVEPDQAIWNGVPVDPYDMLTSRRLAQR